MNALVLTNAPTDLTAAPSEEDRFGRSVAARLSAANADLSHDITERLRSARMQALAHRKVVAIRAAAPVTVVQGNGSALLGGGWWTRVATVVPLVALVVGLIAIYVVQNDKRTREVADVDAALLTDELPPAAYSDPGFVQYLKGAAQPAPAPNAASSTQ